LLVAGFIGLGSAVVTFPPEFLLPSVGQPWAPVGDAAQHAIAQRYFLAAPWGWPPLTIADLDMPRGTHLAFADGIPLLALALKAIAEHLPPGFHGIGLWYAIAHVLQPMAAVWALRGLGERRFWPSIGVALAALAMPAWLARYGHAALTGHFLLLLALGWYFRLVDRQSASRWLGAGLTALAALLVHPYLAAMVLAVLGAAPLTLLPRGGRGFPGAAIGVATVLGGVLGAMAALEYFGATGDGGYGQFAMNLLSPIWPYRSLLLPGVAGAEIDATGKGGWEGYNWLGAGLLAGIVACLLLKPRAVGDALARHLGLVLALLGLTLLAASHRIGVGGAIVLDLGHVPAAMEQFRASGRFFWPVACALLIGTCAMLARVQPAGPLLVVGVGVLQLADSLPIRADLRAWAQQKPAWVLETDALRPMLAQASQLTLLPSWPCIPPSALDSFNQAHQALALASETALPVTTMHLARWREPPRCDDAVLAEAPFAGRELRLILPASLDALLPLVPEAELRCRMVGIAMACVDPPLISLPPPPAAPVPLEPVPEPPTLRSGGDVPPDREDGSSSR
jgi:hypothetical protein